MNNNKNENMNNKTKRYYWMRTRPERAMGSKLRDSKLRESKLREYRLSNGENIEGSNKN